MLKDMFDEKEEDVPKAGRDISDIIDGVYGFSLCHETISNIVDRVQLRVME